MKTSLILAYIIVIATFIILLIAAFKIMLFLFFIVILMLSLAKILDDLMNRL